MATQGNQIRQSFVAGADLTTKKNTFIILTNTGERTVITPAAGAKADGVLLNDPALGVAAAVVTFGRTTVVAGGTIAAGAEVATNATGQAVAATGTNIRLGKTTEAAVAGQVITIDFYPGGNAA